MSTEKRNVAILAACQALLLTANVTVIALAGLVGHSLAENKALATLPVSTFIIGVALTTIPASQWMRRVGRRHGFMTGTGFGILGALICSYAVLTANFWLYCFGTVFLGTNNAFGQQYRFAAAESATSEFKAKAISWVLAAGIVGGVIGPESTKVTKDLFAPHSFLGTYLAVVVLCAFAMALLSRLDLPRTSAEKRGETGRPLCEIMRQPVFIVAVLGAMVGYAVMNLVMTAGPLAMIACSIPYASTIFVVEWHIIGMFAPSFFTGSLIQRFGVLNIMLAGVVLLFGSVAAAVTGISFVHFWTSLFLLGIGWNFLFVGGTTLLTESYTAAEKAKTQGMNDFLVFGSVAVASLSSGGLLHFFGWNAVNLGAVPFLFLTGAATLWLMARRRNAARHPA
jgi:MFS family permease